MSLASYRTVLYDDGVAENIFMMFLILMIHTHYTLSVLVLRIHVFLFLLPSSLFNFFFVFWVFGLVPAIPSGLLLIVFGSPIKQQ